MRSIFLKIFLSFWLIQALILGLALLLAEHPAERVVSRWRYISSDALKHYNETAASFLEQGGIKAADEYLQQLEKSADMQFFWFDSQGRELYGQAASTPKRVRQMAGLAGQTNQPQFENRFDATLTAQVMTASSGKGYILVARMLHGHGPMAFRRSTRELFWHLSLGTFISGLICFWLARYLTGPIVRLRAATQQLASGDFSARAAETERKDEISELVHDFNRMARRLEALVNSQKQLMSDISHELRSPLARLNVALGLARQRATEDVGKALDRIELEAQRLNDLIGKLLTLARLESGEQTPEQRRVNIPDLLKDVIGDADFEAHSRKSRVRLVEIEPAAEDCEALGSPGLLRSAFENVIRNAVRYTAEGSEVEIRLGCEGTHGGNFAVITIRDHGPGVPDEELKNLFRPFYRVDAARERQTGGSGLGLAIAERAVRLHGGTISAANAPNGGFVVEIRLPATTVPSHETVHQ